MTFVIVYFFLHDTGHLREKSIEKYSEVYQNNCYSIINSKFFLKNK